jgi:hypothetical protein
MANQDNLKRLFLQIGPGIDGKARGLTTGAIHSSKIYNVYGTLTLPHKAVFINEWLFRRE